MNIYIENGRIYAGAYNKATSDGPYDGWPWIGVNAPVSANTTYVLTLIYDARNAGPDPNNPATYTGTFSLYLNGNLQGTATGLGWLYGHPGNPGLGAVVGQTVLSNNMADTQPAYFGGDIAEFIHYERVVNESERIIVENYLGAKYVANPIVNDYYAYQVYYGADIVGVGRYAAGDEHTLSQGLNPFIISVNSANLSDGEYLLTGHDGKPLNWTAAGAPEEGDNIQILERNWQFDHYGDVGPVTIRVEASMLPALPPGYTSYAVVLDKSGGAVPSYTNTATTEVVELANVGGGFYEATVNIPKGTFMTLAAFIPTARFVYPSSAVLEGDAGTTPAAIAVRLNAQTAVARSVNYAATGGTATNGGVDYDLPAGTLNFPAGTQELFINFTVTGDVAVEGNEDVIVGLNTPSAGLQISALRPAHTFYIYDNDTPPRFRFDVAASTVNESVGTATVRILRTGDNSTAESVGYRLRIAGGSGTATNGSDYTFTAGTANFAVGQNFFDISIPITDDNEYEADETIILELHSGTIGFDTPFEHTLTIQDNDPQPAVSFQLPTQSNDESVGAPVINVVMDRPSAFTTTVQYAIISGTATNGFDYSLAATGTVTFTPGTTVAPLSIVTFIYDDAIPEANENFVIELQSVTTGNAVTDPSQRFHNYVIIDNDPFGWQASAGVGMLPYNVFWFKADALTGFAHNATVDTWTDASPNANDATQANAANRARIQSTANTLNGFPVMRFDGNDFYLLPYDAEISIPSPYYEKKALFLVVRTGADVATRQVIYEQGGGSRGLNVYIENGNIYFHAWNDADDDGGVTTPWGGSTGTKYVSAPIAANTAYVLSFIYNHSDGADGNISAYVNGTAIGTATGVGRLFAHNAAVLGGVDNDTRFHDNSIVASGNYFTGDIAEVIYYNDKDIHEARRIIVENYLAGKYGIALSANAIYTYSATHAYHIAGIGQSSSSEAVHIDAQGENRFRIRNADDLQNNEYLFIGDDNVPVVNNTERVDVPSGAFSRLKRTWRVAEQGEVGSVQFIMDANGIVVTDASHLRLYIDTDKDGQFSDEFTFFPASSYDSGNQLVYFDNVDFNNGDIFTLVSMSSFSPLPVEFKDFVAEAEGQDVKLYWTTAQELNAAYYEIERSQDLLVFETIGRVKAAGNTQSLQAYNWTDKQVQPGTWYYRIKQVDADGQAAWSEVRSVLVSGAQQSIRPVVFPNPTMGSVHIEGVKAQAELLLFDTQGRLLMQKTVTGNDMLDLSELPRGVYVLRITDGQENQTLRLVKQ
ncbi:MAG: hypothetical protein KatS3mg033_2345 [Thermonema sp.]|uniref:Calx-beta domain-containing protein n=1 Tax=Thermonema sp. TaxID=2231181 RepID=UPI0021DE53C8|nr:Calx-beta domain-containing protein [Thermonema sp.]GIV40545.1 MAG: hypothetical protein KatS3mg033_2345 [Thermonema sp.]